MSADRVAALAEVLRTSRMQHQIDVMQSNLLACTCGDRLPLEYDGEGRLLHNPAIRHHEERGAEAILASPVMRDLLAKERAWALRKAASEVALATGRSSGVPVWRVEISEWLNDRADREQP